jgi:hypothetical protein
MVYKENISAIGRLQAMSTSRFDHEIWQPKVLTRKIPEREEDQVLKENAALGSSDGPLVEARFGLLFLHTRGYSKKGKKIRTRTAALLMNMYIWTAISDTSSIRVFGLCKTELKVVNGMMV